MTTHPDTPARKESSNESLGARVRKFFVSLAVLAVVGGAAYGAAFLQGQARIEAMKEKLEAAHAQHSRDTADLRERLEEAEHRLHQLEARRHLTLAAMALDEKNFGIAQEHVDSAARFLKESAADELWQSLVGRIVGLRVQTLENVDQNRSNLVEAIKRFDELLPAARPPSEAEQP